MPKRVDFLSPMRYNPKEHCVILKIICNFVYPVAFRYHKRSEMEQRQPDFSGKKVERNSILGLHFPYGSGITIV